MNNNDLEQYVLAENKEDYLKGLSNTSPIYNFITSLNKLLDSDIDQKELDDIIKNYNHIMSTNDKQSIKWIFYVNEIIKNKSNSSKLKTALQKFNDIFLSYQYAYRNPFSNIKQNLCKEKQFMGNSFIDKKTQEKLSVNHYIQKLYSTKKCNILEKINNQFIKFIDYKKFNKNDIEILEYLLENMTDVTQLQKLCHYILSLNISDCPLDDQVYQKIQKIYTLEEQMLLLKKKKLSLPKNKLINFIETYFQNESETTQIKSQQYYQQQLIITNKKKDFCLELQCLKDIIFTYDVELLYYQMKKKNYNFDDFMQILTYQFQVEAAYKKLHSYYQDNDKIIPEGISDLNTTQTNNYLKHLYIKYIKQFCLQTNYFNQFSKYFEKHFLINIKCNKLLSKGIVDKYVNDNLSPEVIQQYIDKKQIQLKNNKQKFTKNEKVSINAKIKNIKQLEIKIYEVNTLNYLKSNAQKNYQNINTDGLMPIESFQVDFTHEAIIKHNEVFDFDSISSKERGVFIIDLQYENISSRAIICKGSLSIIYDRITGRNCSIVDEDGTLCKGQQTGIYIQNTFLAANENGLIKIPLNIKDLEAQIITVHNDFSDLAYINVTSPIIQLFSNLVYNKEMFMSGNKVHLLIQLKLLMNGQKISLKKLINTSITYKMINDEQIETKKEIKNAILSDQEDYVLEFIYPMKTKSIFIQVNSDYQIAGQTQKLCTSQQIDIQEFVQNKISHGFFKQNQKKEVFFSLYGKNGEALINQEVSISILLKCLNKKKQFNLWTDKNGSCQFGNIKDLYKIQVNYDQDTYFYNAETDGEIYYPQNIPLISGEKYKLQIKTQNKKIVLYKLSKCLKYKHSILGENNIQIGQNELTLRDLQKGDYILQIDKHNLKLNVHEGRYLKLNGENIITEDKIIAIQKNNEFLDYNITENEQEYKINVFSDSCNIRSHLLMQNFIYDDDHQLYKNIKNYGINNQTTSELSYQLSKNNNIFQSGKQLSDELIYIQQRKKKNHFMGNTLEKPGMILVRNLVGETKEDDQKLREATQYLKTENKCDMPVPSCRKYKKLQEKELFSEQQKDNKKLITPIEFIANQKNIISNIKPDNGIITIEKEQLKNYANNQLIISDGNLQTIIAFEHNNSQNNFKDVRLQKSKKKGSICIYNRVIKPLLENETVTIEQINKTKMSIISNTEQLFNILTIINKNNTVLNEWQFLVTWPDMTFEEKILKYDKYASNELNIFIFFKDKEFFEQVVQPFIMNKKEKLFIDFVLLNNKEEVKKYCNYSAICHLNIIELCLLAYISPSIDKQFSDCLIQYIKQKSLLNTFDVQRKEQIIDTLLSSKGEQVIKQHKPPQMPNNSYQQYGQLSDYVCENSLNQQKKMYMPCSYQLQCETKIQQQNSIKKKCRRTQQCKTKEKKERFYDARKEEEEDIEDDVDAQQACYYEEGAEIDGICLDEENFIEDKNITFTPSQTTMEYEEKKNYNTQQYPSMNEFWFELALHLNQHQSTHNFMPKEFLFDCKSIYQQLIILSTIDLPVHQKDYNSNIIDNDIQLTANDNFYTIFKQIQEKEADILEMDVISTLKYFDPENQFIIDEETDTQIEKPVKEFISGKIYGCRLIVTNCTQSPIDISMIYEIPQGSIPTKSQDFVYIKNQNLNSLQSKVYEYFFYFPKEGTYTVYPFTVVRNDKIVSIASTPENIIIQKTLQIKQTETIQDILATGNKKDIIDFMQTKNILNKKIFDFNQIYWLLNDKQFYDQVIKTLHQKCIFDEIVSSFSIIHKDYDEFILLLKNKAIENFKYVEFYQNGDIIIDRFKLREYYPLINPRAHSVGDSSTNILNKQFKNTYEQFLKYLLFKKVLAVKDKIILCNYLIVQDRLEEAINLHSQIKIKMKINDQCLIQYDYLSAYLYFMTRYPSLEEVKSIIIKYINYPVITWRNLFIDMANQITEYLNCDTFQQDKQELVIEGEVQNKLKASLNSSLQAYIEQNKIKLITQNVQNVNIKYYKLDLEILFSLNPFDMFQYNNYNILQPFCISNISITGKAGEFITTYFPIKQSLMNDNLYIQVDVEQGNDNKSVYLQYVPFNLDYVIQENFGIIKIIDKQEKKPVQKIYVKCYAKYKNGNIQFYKDGYTDIRGSFDYVSLNKDKLDDITKYSILVISEKNGCLNIVVEPPKKIGRTQGELKQLYANTWIN